ncbi:branched-chain amino acid transport system permease protein [Modestobacter sp. DSM 44400]|uniref:branched-chain amino acid ABC transporter permease n=1 Tax=Modestobacter sp. DSM 44400 TaxID=1550230 RepID=UPI000899F9B8|nr:branched-chain amino acid ABC transporter permease [Modestobacter sp. DSM 44400]SDX80237.1 branched-chain amino acid transport system permease protein [Modestobacter sp. DSM 44400]
MVWLSNVLNGLAFGSLLFLVASGLTITFGLMRTINLAHGAFYLVGGYLAFDLYVRTGSYWLSLVVAVVVTAVIGMLVERLLLHRLLNQELPQIILTVGVSLMIGDLLLTQYGGSPISPPTPAGLEGSMQLFGSVIFPKFRAFLIVLALVLAALIMAFLRFSSIGAKVRSAVDDQEIARTIGIRVPLIFLLVFGAGTALAAFAGVWGGALTSLSPDTGLDVLLLALVVVVVGGLGSVPGALIAAFAVGLLDQFGKVLFPEWSLFTIYAPVALFLAFRPNGLLGKVESR